MPAQIVVRVPASSANLGPGFDTLGLALRIDLTCRFTPADRLRIRASGRDAASIPTDESNLIWQTALTVAKAQRRTLSPIDLSVENNIPIGKGFGSSAAALVAGVAIADRVLGLHWDEHRLLDEAARIEGHPDNVAAAVLGSAITAAIGADGVTRAVRLEIPRAFSVATVCPDFELSTPRMRDVLPASYLREDAVFNLQRATLLVAALLTGSREAFPEAFEDRLHQPYRQPLIPGMEGILNLRMAGLLGCALSGSGPAILVFYETGKNAVVEAVSNEFEKVGLSSEIMFSDLDRQGLVVTTATE